MSFEQEWSGLVTNARARQSASMQINGASTPNGGGDGGGGKGGKDLQVTASVLRSYAGRAEKVSDEFQKTDNETMRETEQVPGSMKGFASDEAFKDFQVMWRKQMKYLDGLYTGVAKSLRSAATTFKAEDVRRKVDLDRLDPSKPLLPNSPRLPNSPLQPPYSLQPNSPLLPGADGTTPLSPRPPLYGPYVPNTLPKTDEPTS
ncbi:WXG100 family type VII secretion target [Streptomyces sp. NPDC048172]|uniref:WXG100 family type VII secretion target n=1 Tax=Streptomyces sp. NPDC048172 TaxID=3365505 RepID=UPI003717C372